MKVSTSKVIKKPVESVWLAITNHNNWYYWYGDSLLEVAPDWVLGAKLIWKRGLPSTVSGLIPMRLLSVKLHGGAVASWKLHSDPQGSRVELLCDYTGAEHALTDADAAASFWGTRLEALKHFVEFR